MSLIWNLNILIILIYFIAILLNGIIASRKVKNLKDFASGNKSYKTFFIFATLSSSFIGGGFTTGLAEKVYTYGFIFVLALWGFSIKEVLIGKYIVPKMEKFKEAISAGDIMASLYGHNAKIFTGIASVLVCAGITGAQFSAFGYMVNLLLGINQVQAVLLASSIVILYSSMGGMRAVVANDTLHFIVLITALPIVLILGLNYIGGIGEISSSINFSSEKISFFNILIVFISFFFGETLVPPYVQRLLIGKDLNYTKRATIYSGVLSFIFFVMIGIIGLIAFKINPSINANLAMPYVINTVMPLGLKGLAIAGMMAVIMSSADSFLNASAIAMSHDIIRPLYKIKNEKNELLLSRLSTVVIGLLGSYFALSGDSVLDILLSSYSFWTPFILVPLSAGILGIKRSKQTFWISSFFGVATVLIINYTNILKNSFVDSTLFGILVNATIFFTLRAENQLIRPQQAPHP